MEYSLCILHYGDPALTRNCLRSTLHLRPAPIERIIVWNDPRRRADEVLEEGLQVGVRLIEPPRNLGFSGGANLGAGRAFTRGDVDALLLLNNDAVVTPESVESLLGALISDPGVGMAGPRILEQGTGRIWHDGGWIEWPGAQPHSDRFGLELPPDDDPTPRTTGFVCGCAPLIRREAFESVGGFDERYFLFYEDVDLSLRMTARGWRLVHVPRAVVHHVGSCASEERVEVARYYRLRNRLLMIQEHAPDRAAARRTCRAIRRRSLWWSWTRSLVGRGTEARAVRAALRDAAAGRWGGGAPCDTGETDSGS